MQSEVCFAEDSLDRYAWHPDMKLQLAPAFTDASGPTFLSTKGHRIPVTGIVQLMQLAWYRTVIPTAACLLEGQLNAPCCFTDQLHNKSYISVPDCIGFVVVIICTGSCVTVYM